MARLKHILIEAGSCRILKILGIKEKMMEAMKPFLSQAIVIAGICKIHSFA